MRSQSQHKWFRISPSKAMGSLCINSNVNYNNDRPERNGS